MWATTLHPHLHHRAADALIAQTETIARLTEALAEIEAVAGCLEGKDPLDRELIRNIGDSIRAALETSK